MYYLKSRYYDPEICRFINADDASMLGADGEFVSYNLFGYCEDSPTNRTDDGGHFSNILIGAIVGAVIGGFSSAVRGGSFKEVVISAAAGAVSGAFCAMGFWGVLAGSTINGVVTAISSDGSTAEKVIRGSIAFGSTLFLGKLWQWTYQSSRRWVDRKPHI